MLLHVSHLSSTISLAVRFEAGYCTSLSLVVSVCKMGTNVCTLEDFLRKLNEIVSVTHLAQCLAQHSPQMVVLVMLEIILWRTPVPILFSFSKLPRPLLLPPPSPFFFLSLWFSSTFSNPTHNSERMEEDRVVYFETKFNIDPQKKQPLQYALLPHKRYI